MTRYVRSPEGGGWGRGTRGVAQEKHRAATLKRIMNRRHLVIAENSLLCCPVCMGFMGIGNGMLSITHYALPLNLYGSYSSPFTHYSHTVIPPPSPSPSPQSQQGRPGALFLPCRSFPLHPFLPQHSRIPHNRSLRGSHPYGRGNRYPQG